MTMPAVVLTADRTIAFQERPRPSLQPDQVIVEVELCGICGSDLHAAQLPQVYLGAASSGTNRWGGLSLSAPT
jgi:threonine dehydrogenase-like Zn-dependent dehydrogenase